MASRWRSLLGNRRGQALAEYAILLGLLCAGLVVVLAMMGGHIRNIFSHGNDTVAEADGSPAGPPAAGPGAGNGPGNGNGNGPGNGNGNGNGLGNGNGNGNSGNGLGNGGPNGN